MFLSLATAQSPSTNSYAEGSDTAAVRRQMLAAGAEDHAIRSNDRFSSRTLAMTHSFVSDVSFATHTIAPRTPKMIANGMAA
jgi:hypothetical protein